MAQQSLTVEQFGSRLLATGDLDPIYVMLTGAHKDGVLDRATLQRWCLAYWCYYHAGTASRLAEQHGESFWSSMAAALPDAPRGSERRHFRGKNGASSIKYLWHRYPHPEDAVRYAAYGSAVDEPPADQLSRIVRDRVEEWTGFGPWISFKVADMVDAVLGVPVDFADSLADWFTEPVKGAVYVHLLHTREDARTHNGFNTSWMDEQYDALSAYERMALVIKTVHRMQLEFRDLRKPHAPLKPVDIQEIETVLCKYKSHLRGHYPVGKDTHEIRHGLSQVRSSLGSQLAQYLPSL